MEISTSPTQFTDWYCSKHKKVTAGLMGGLELRGSLGYFLFGLQKVYFSVNDQKDVNLNLRIIPLIFAMVYEHVHSSGFLRSSKECQGEGEGGLGCQLSWGPNCIISFCPLVYWI